MQTRRRFFMAAALFVGLTLTATTAIAQTCTTWCRSCDETPKLKGCTSINGETIQICGNAEPPAVFMGCICVADQCVNDLDPTNAATDPAFFMGCPSVVGAFCN